MQSEEISVIELVECKRYQKEGGWGLLTLWVFFSSSEWWRSLVLQVRFNAIKTALS